MSRSSAQHELLPSVCIVLGGVLWGLFWLPVRMLGEMGLEGGWAGAVIYAGTAAVLLPFLPFRWRQVRRYGWPLLWSGLFTGTAFAFYSISLLMTDVVRVILLFYLTPVWGTLLGIALLGERLTASRATALGLGAAGLLVVLGVGEEFPWPHDLGDWLALCSGLAWAYGSLRLYRMGAVAVPEQIMAFVVGSLVVTIAAIALGGAAFGAVPETALLAKAAPLGLLGAVYVLPMLFLTIWPATLLSPGRIGLLLMSEVVVGVASAATFAGEPFGAREALGTILIVAAGVVEVLGNRAILRKAGLDGKSG